MLWKQVSAGAKQCCAVLWAAGFEAYPVGGCVRDLLLGRRPGDWDVTTSARPEQIINLFERVIATGVKHGTVTVIFGEEHLEVTTFRGESGYSDGRHPDTVTFDAGLEEDLARRDFTINAMALAPDGTVIDRFGGRADLERKVIRCVGEPERRFSEDGLRMFRGVRFAAQLGFELTQDTVRAIRACADGAGRIAAERIRVEVEKTLCSSGARQVRDFFELGLMRNRARCVTDGFERLNDLPNEPMLRWAGLCGLLKEREAGQFLEGLRLDGRTVRACRTGEALWLSGLPDKETDWRKALAQHGVDGCRAAAAMGDVSVGTDTSNLLGRVLEQAPCVRVEDLALSGGELMAMGLRGMEIGAAQRYLLEHVLNCPEDNRAEVLALKMEEFSSRS